MKRGWIFFIIFILIISIVLFYVIDNSNPRIHKKDIIYGEPINSFLDISKNTCPDNCILEDGLYYPLINHLTVSINPGELDKEEQFLSETIYERVGVSYVNWMNYSPMVEKVNELTKNSTSQLDKAEKILYWLKNSKTFCEEGGYPNNCISMANFNGGYNSEKFYTYNEIFDYPYGVCIDSVILGIGMLRSANIPSTYVMVGMSHIVIVFFAEGRWYTADATFFTKNNPDFGHSEPSIIDLKESSSLFAYFDTSIHDSNYPLYSTYPQIFSFDYISKDYSEVFFPNGYSYRGKNQYICNFFIENFDAGFYIPRKGNDIRWTNLNTNFLYLLDNSNNPSNFGYVYYRLSSDYLYKYECSKITPRSFLFDLREKPVVTIYLKPLEDYRIVLTPEKFIKSNGASSKDFNELVSLIFSDDLYRKEALSILKEDISYFGK